MAEILRVRNWEKLQHYKDRSPPWIKLHRELLRDYEFSCLQDASKLHLMLIWLLASQLDNKIPNDPEWIQRHIGTAEPPNIKELISCEFLIVERIASKPLAQRKQSAMPETEAYKEEAEAEKEAEADTARRDESHQAESVVLTIPLVDKSEYKITTAQILDWQQDFPGINAELEARKCRAWNVANPKNRKTRAGILRHVTAWLTRAQDRAPTGGSSGNQKTSAATRQYEAARRQAEEFSDSS